MILTKVTANHYVAKKRGNELISGSLEEVIDVLSVQFNVMPSEINLAVHEMHKGGYKHAEFGVSSRFCYCYNDNDGEAA